MVGKGYVLKVLENNYLLLRNKEGQYTAVLLSSEEDAEGSYITEDFQDLDKLLDSICIANGCGKGSVHYASEIKTFHMSNIINLDKHTNRACGCSAYSVDDGRCLESKESKRCDSCYSEYSKI